jgi:pantothenate kinase
MSVQLPNHLRERAELLLERSGPVGASPRLVLGLTGPPGAGKSTLAEALVAALGPVAVLVPMDGFHLAQVELERLGRADRKGAPDTFDAAGFAEVLRRARHDVDETVYAPMFRRDIEEPIAGAIAVTPEVRLVVTEGNYLLDERPPWDRVRPLLDEAWYLEVEDSLRRSRLVARHISFGRDEPAARDWVRTVDEPNAVLATTYRPRADLVIQWG